ncbi:MAG: hypothetical protein JNK82_02835, partial [Myxococcaceae bacterium]|nr:hypothetical protein [Myxococcaceae bacterium]
MRLSALVCSASLFFVACNCGSTAPSVEGEPCGPTRGCEEELTCRDGICVPVGGTAGGSATAGGS